MKTEINGFSMHYEVGGLDSGPWLTLSHALSTDMTLWDELASDLGRDFRILRYDQRGHGRSEAVPGPYSFPDLIGDVLALWDAVGVDRSHWLGLSIGGMIGYGLAIHHPERILSLVACDSQADAPPDYAAYFQSRIDKAAAGGMENLVQATLERWFTAETLRRRDPVIDRVAEMIRNTDEAGHRGCCEALKTLSYGSELHRIKTPALIVGGAQDKGAPPDALAKVAERIEGAAHAVIPRAGHISALENPTDFASEVRAFLMRVR